MLKKSHNALTVNAGINHAKEGKSAFLICAFKFREIMKLGLICHQKCVTLPLTVARAVLDFLVSCKTAFSKQPP